MKQFKQGLIINYARLFSFLVQRPQLLPESAARKKIN
jgi:hypothetical protein